MAKEKEYTVEERLKALYELQTLLSEIDRIKTLRGELPLEVKDLEDSIIGLETRLENYKNDIKEFNASVSAHKVGIQEAQALIEKYKEQLLQRLATSGLELDINDERILKEVCLFADRCDICEEITRLKSHIKQFLATMEETDAVGRKMDFICQEMGREINTTASKANSLELTKLAIELKNELERIREQTQNIL